jgi:branched-subunit amino acid ABC-type transport system permease component
MWVAQVLINALVLGCLYACIAIGFSLVWGVLNVINLIHGSFIVLGAYLAWGLYQALAIPPWYVLVIAAPLFFILGFLLQWLLLNRVISAPVLVTLTLTFGLDLILNNAMICQIDLCGCLRSWRRVGGMRRRADGADLSDFAADLIGLSRQGLRGLRARWSRQRVGGAGRRPAAGAG